MAPGDLEGVLAIEQTTLTPWSLEMLAAELRYAAGVALVAEDQERGGPIVGWCAARLVAPEAELLKIAVAEDARCRGVGGALLVELGRLLNAAAVSELFLEVRAHNHPALALYHRHGFVAVGKRPGYYGQPKDDALLLRKRLR